MKKISIIIPMYNVENTIKECVNSVINQTYKNLEIILIDDGSIDRTKEICKKMAEEDDRIRYFYKENNGVSSARNLGLRVCTGDYIAFIDSDDTVESDTYNILMKEIKDNELIIFDWYETKNGEKKLKKVKVENNTSLELDTILKVQNKALSQYLNPPWNRLIDSKLIKNNNIMFDQEISLGEDLLFNLHVICLAKRIKSIDKKLYFYNITDSGLCMKKRNSNQYINNSIRLIKSMVELSNIYNNKLDNIIINEIWNVITRLSEEYEKEDILKFFKEIEKNKINKTKFNYVSNRNKIIVYLLKHKKYSIISCIFKIKSMIKKKSIWRRK